MHLIMNALEEVTSRAHPNVSEISLLITLVSVSARFEPDEKFHRIKETRWAYSCAHYSSSIPAVSCEKTSCCGGLSKEVAHTSRLLLHPGTGNLNGE